MPSIRKFCARMTPAQRFEFFSLHGEGRHLWPAHICDEQRQQLLRNHRRARNTVCSASWHDARWHGKEYPPGGDDTAMALSDVKVRWGEGEGHRRWTPPQCVRVEDGLDSGDMLAMKIADAMPSPSALAIHRLRHYNRDAIRRLADDRGKMGRGRAQAGKSGRHV